MQWSLQTLFGKVQYKTPFHSPEISMRDCFPEECLHNKFKHVDTTCMVYMVHYLIAAVTRCLWPPRNGCQNKHDTVIITTQLVLAGAVSIVITCIAFITLLLQQ